LRSFVNALTNWRISDVRAGVCREDGARIREVVVEDILRDKMTEIVVGVLVTLISGIATWQTKWPLLLLNAYRERQQRRLEAVEKLFHILSSHAKDVLYLLTQRSGPAALDGQAFGRMLRIGEVRFTDNYDPHVRDQYLVASFELERERLIRIDRQGEVTLTELGEDFGRRLARLSHTPVIPPMSESTRARKEREKLITSVQGEPARLLVGMLFNKRECVSLQLDGVPQHLIVHMRCLLSWDTPDVAIEWIMALELLKRLQLVNYISSGDDHSKYVLSTLGMEVADELRRAGVRADFDRFPAAGEQDEDHPM
jgi:hypothetical protein